MKSPGVRLDLKYRLSLLNVHSFSDHLKLQQYFFKKRTYNWSLNLRLSQHPCNHMIKILASPYLQLLFHHPHSTAALHCLCLLPLLWGHHSGYLLGGTETYWHSTAMLLFCHTWLWDYLYWRKAALIQPSPLGSSHPAMPHWPPAHSPPPLPYPAIATYLLASLLVSHLGLANFLPVPPLTFLEAGR